MIQHLTNIAVLVLAGFSGALAHEVAHWIVWRFTGRRPLLDLRGLSVKPRGGPQQTTTGDRIAAAAPYVIGCCCILLWVSSGGLTLLAFGLAMVQIPSGVDVATVRGRTVWKVQTNAD